MIIKKYKPTSPAMRSKIVVRDDNLWKKGSYKKLTFGKVSISGRNHSGRITRYHRGGGHKRKYRIIDNTMSLGLYSWYQVVRLEYDPNRSGNIALCKTNQNKYFYILAAHDMKENDIIYGRNSLHHHIHSFNPGSILPLKEIPLGSFIYNLQKNKYAEFGKAAGVSCQLLKLSGNLAIVRLPSKKIITVDYNNLAFCGRVSNIYHDNTVLGSAGRSRHLGRRPTVRAVAMNPVDHPMGGKTPVSGGLGGAHKTKWGKLAKWNKKKK